jgi:FMN-dependent NADH-azoreductase
MTLLHIVASPRKQRSASIEVANAFIDAWKSANPEADVDVLNVWETDLLPFDKAALDAKYAGIEGRTRTTEEQGMWDQIGVLADRFHRADLLLFSVPMWNFGIPYRLKHLIDVISQKDVLFTFDERGLLGMLGGRKAVVISARGVLPRSSITRERIWQHGRAWWGSKTFMRLRWRERSLARRPIQPLVKKPALRLSLWQGGSRYRKAQGNLLEAYFIKTLADKELSWQSTRCLAL